jgi:uncharacterized protein with von Willebrand factor type A (vWA) domain
MIFLWNPTNEDFPLTYGGLSYTLYAGKKLKVEEAMGNHALNALGSRGLTKLVFDDEGHSVAEEQIGQDAIARNKEFKVRQIVTYNERNERRRTSGQPYDLPTKTVQKYAVELGIELLKPYTLATAEIGQIGTLSKENEDLKIQLKQQEENTRNLMESFKEMQEMMKGGFVKAEVKEVKSTDYVTCTECGEEILPNRLKSHMKAKHKR